MFQITSKKVWMIHIRRIIHNIVTWLIDCRRFWIMIGFIELLRSVTQSDDSLTELYVVHSKDHWNYSTYKVFSEYPSHCLVSASNSGLSPYSGFSSGPRPQLPASPSNSSQQLNPIRSLNNSPANRLTPLHWLTPKSSLTTSRHGQHRKHRSFVVVYGPLPSTGRCLVVCFSVIA
jgi:hypothetical protein